MLRRATSTECRMIKFSETSHWNFGIEPVSIIRDVKSLVKRASAEPLLKYAKTKGQTDVHLIALGAYEGTGYNRNMDCFLESDCIKNAHWFVDSGVYDKVKKAYDGRAFNRHHKNKPEDPKYGNIKAAAYNHNMRRLELIVGHDDDKCADILDEIEKKGQANYSMASKQEHDICSWCKHAAATDKDRCEHIPEKLGEINKIGEVCGMINPNPRWFEISYVKRPADRIGMSLKIASSEHVRMLPSDYLNLYTGFVSPDEPVMISKKASDKRYLITKMAEMEKRVEAIAQGKATTTKEKYIAEQASKLKDSDHLSDSTIDELRKFEPSKLLKALADNGIILNPDEFTKYTFGDRVKKERVEGMKTHLPGIFSKLKDNCDDVVNDEHFEPSSMDFLPKEIRSLVGGLADGHSMFGPHARNRVIRITIIKRAPGSLKPEPHDEEKSKLAFDRELAKTYATYKLAALNYLDEQGKLDDEIIWNALIQNR